MTTQSGWETTEDYEAHIVLNVASQINTHPAVRILKKVGKGLLYGAAILAVGTLGLHVVAAHAAVFHEIRAMHVIGEVVVGLMSAVGLASVVAGSVLEKKQAQETVAVEEKEAKKQDVFIKNDVDTGRGSASPASTYSNIHEGLTGNNQHPNMFILAASAALAIKAFIAVFSGIASKLASMIGAAADSTPADAPTSSPPRYPSPSPQD